MGVCRFTSSDHLYTSSFGLEFCVSGQSFPVTGTRENPWEVFLIKKLASCRTQQVTEGLHATCRNAVGEKKV